jgi:hypothetical protein
MRSGPVRAVADSLEAGRLPGQRAPVGFAHAYTGDENLGLFSGPDRSRLAVVVTTDGRRVHLPMGDAGLVDVALLPLLRSLLLGLDGLLGLITGSRRENRGSRR